MSPAFRRRPVRGGNRARRASPQFPTLGRPRDARIDAEVVDAVLSALRDGGYRAVTMEGIARRVGRARSSIYRRWPSKRHLVAYAVLSVLGEDPAADTGSTRGDLEAAVATLLRAFAGPLGAALPGLVADMAQDAALAAIIRAKVLTPRRRSMREALERAQRRGEARRDVDVETVLDMLTGPFYFRALFGHAPVSRRSMRSIVDYVLRLLAPPGR
jgi:AcrR family transcriptional regulator